MTQTELMENLAEFLSGAVKEYVTQQSKGELVPVKVYPGYPPIKTTSRETESCIYVLVTECEDTEEQTLAKVEIGFSIFDSDPAEGWRSLYNLMEHVRQTVLKTRTVAKKHRLQLPIKSKLADDQPFPQWLGLIEVKYTLGKPVEEEMDYGY